jgi:thymidylate synthase
MLPHERPLVAEEQLREASLDQIEDLVQRLNLALQERGMPVLVWQQTPEDRGEEDRTATSDPFDPPTI